MTKRLNGVKISNLITLFFILYLTLFVGCSSESPQDAFLNETQTDTTADSDLPTDSAELISAFFGLDNGLPRTADRGICQGAGNADGMPVIFSTEIDLETMQAGDFQVITASGEIGTITCVTLAPAIDEGELRTVLVVGEFGSADSDPPTTVEIIGNIHSIDQTINFKGATVAVTPLDPGPSIVFAEIVPREMWHLGRESDGSWGSSNGCPTDGVEQVVRATWNGGVTLSDDKEITNADRDLYAVTVQSADGTTREITPFALGDLDDGDNNHELCLDTADKPISIFFPEGHFTDPNDDLNPETTISIP